MLTIKEPIRLQGITTLRTHSDILGEKIAANYQLTGTTVTGADLLHMTVREPEQFLNMEYHGILTVANRIHADNRMKMELVNQLVNRLMFCFTPDFTYQDEVFVASVLQKMGITDVREFMQQIHRHMERNELLAWLTDHYFSHAKEIAEIVGFYRERFADVHKAAVYGRKHRPDWHLHREIFQRLMTAECNNIVYSYQCQTDWGRTAMQGVREAAWAGQADAIQLPRLREILFHQENPAFWQDDMYYERKSFGQEGLTEEKVLQHMAAAVLENMVQKIHYIWRQYRDRGIVRWRDYTRIFCQGAADVLKRFCYFQNGDSAGIVRRQTYVQSMGELMRDERVLVQLLETIGVPQDGSRHGDETGQEAAGSSIVLALWENQNIQGQLAARMRPGRMQAGDGQTGLQEDGAEHGEELRALREIRTALRQSGESWEGRQYQEVTDSHMVLQKAREQSPRETALRQGIQDSHGKLYGQDLSCVQGSGGQMDAFLDGQDLQRAQGSGSGQMDTFLDGQSLQRAQDGSYDYIGGFLRRYEEFVTDRKVPFMENARLLEQVNQHNLYMRQLLDSVPVPEGRPGRVVVDRAKARQSALRAMDDPQEALREIYRNAPAIKKGLPLEIEKILRVTDEKSRLFYRKILGYPIDSEPSGQADDASDIIQDEITVSRAVEDMAADYAVVQDEITDSRTAGDMAAEYAVVKDKTTSSRTIGDMAAEYIAVLDQAADSRTAGDMAVEYGMENVTESGSVNSRAIGGAIGRYNAGNNIENGIVYDRIPDPGIGGHSAGNAVESDGTDNRTVRKAAKYSEDSIAGADTANSSVLWNAIAKTDGVDSGVPRHTPDTASADVPWVNRAMAILGQIEENGDRIYRETILRQYMDTAVGSSSADASLFFRERPSSNPAASAQDRVLAQLKAREKNMPVNDMDSSGFRGIDFIHKTEPQMSVNPEAPEGSLSARAGHILQSEEIQAEMRTKVRSQLRQARQERASREQQEQQLQDMKQRLFDESGEQLSQMISQNLKAQVHTISDTVYRELERRLKNEQRRRGY